MTHETGEVGAAAETWACEIFLDKVAGARFCALTPVWSMDNKCWAVKGRPQSTTEESCGSSPQPLCVSFFIFYFPVVADAPFSQLAYKFDWILQRETERDQQFFGVMKLLLISVFMAFFAVVQVFCEENEPREDTDYWTSSNQIQVGYTCALG